jgi:hypothetical protein
MNLSRRQGVPPQSLPSQLRCRPQAAQVCNKLYSPWNEPNTCKTNSATNSSTKTSPLQTLDVHHNVVEEKKTNKQTNKGSWNVKNTSANQQSFTTIMTWVLPLFLVLHLTPWKKMKNHVVCSSVFFLPRESQVVVSVN